MRNRLVLIMLSLLAACAGQPAPEAAELPTLAALPTAAPTDSPTPPTPSATPTTTFTAAPTATATPSVTPSATITDTPSPTATATPTITPMPLPTADNEGIAALAALALRATIVPLPTLPPAPPAFIPTGAPLTTACPAPPPGGFGALTAADPTLTALIGCPVGVPLPVSSAAQPYERGGMLWLAGPPPAVYALFNTGRFSRYDDTYNPNTDPFSGGEAPPPGLVEPVRGFGKVWRTFPEVRAGLGWALADEAGATATVLFFERGQMVYLPQRGEIVTLANDPGGAGGTWRAAAGSP